MRFPVKWCTQCGLVLFEPVEPRCINCNAQMSNYWQIGLSDGSDKYVKRDISYKALRAKQ